MIIRHLTLRNWRNFTSVDVELGRRAFIVGPNASGKSNFLDALRFLRDVARPGGGLQAAVRSRGGLSKIRSLAARSKPVVEVAIRAATGNGPEWSYSLKFTARPRDQVQVDSETVTKDGKEVLSRPDKSDEKDPDRLTQTHLEQISSNQEFREVAKMLTAISYLNVIPQVLRMPEPPSAQYGEDDPLGRGFFEKIASTLEKKRTARLKVIGDALKIAVPQLGDLRFEKDDAGVSHLEAKYQHWRPNAGWQREDQFSDGTLRLIALLWNLLDGDSPLLLEEPEISLNAGIVQRLAEILHQAQRKTGRQILMSTHSFELLSDKSIGAEETVVLNPTKEGTEVMLGSTDAQILRMLHGGLSVADAILPRTVPQQMELLQLS